jgi:predicted ATPase
LRADGKIKSKTNYSRENAQLIKNFKELLKNGEVEGEPVEDFNPEEGLIELLLYEAIQLANAENDEQLECACKQYLEALSHYENDSKGLNLQFWTLISPDSKLHISGKSKKNPKPEGFKPKRGRGRPPKGSKL